VATQIKEFEFIHRRSRPTPSDETSFRFCTSETEFFPKFTVAFNSARDTAVCPRRGSACQRNQARTGVRSSGRVGFHPAASGVEPIMLNLTSHLRIYLHVQPVDMRKSFDGLFGIVKNEFGKDPRQGGLFLFLNRSRNRIKLMYWDVDGIAIWMKRLERGSFQHPHPSSTDQHLIIDAAQLHLLLSGIELQSIKRRKRYSVPEFNEHNAHNEHNDLKSAS
jgi:transposase